MCVCVCVREREREGTVDCCHSVHLNVSKGTISTANLLIACVTREREREEKNIAAKDMASLAARLLLYQLEMTRH